MWERRRPGHDSSSAVLHRVWHRHEPRQVLMSRLFRWCHICNCKRKKCSTMSFQHFWKISVIFFAGRWNLCNVLLSNKLKFTVFWLWVTYEQGWILNNELVLYFNWISAGCWTCCQTTFLITAWQETNHQNTGISWSYQLTERLVNPLEHWYQLIISAYRKVEQHWHRLIRSAYRMVRQSKRTLASADHISLQKG
jgi:hypothetical protein